MQGKQLGMWAAQPQKCAQVMRMWPFRSLIVRSGASQEAKSTVMQPCQAFYFGDTEHIMQAARMSNRLTGYVFLLDASGRMRWQASGPAQVCLQAPAGIGMGSSGTCRGCKAVIV